jgi:hypothetical protein
MLNKCFLGLSEAFVLNLLMQSVAWQSVVMQRLVAPLKQDKQRFKISEGNFVI